MFVVPEGTGWKPASAPDNHRSCNPTFRIDLERAVTGVGQRAIRHLDLEKAGALDGYIQVVAGIGKLTISENAGRGDGNGPLPDLQAPGQFVAATLLRTRRPRGLGYSKS